MEPAYLELSKKELERRTQKAWRLLDPCRVCPRECRVNRTLRPRAQGRVAQGDFGFCRMGKNPVISSAYPHFGEEAPLVGRGGSGTIFFSSCNLTCVYCQNYEISQLRFGSEIEFGDLAQMMIRLQNLDCHNINLVSPGIWAPQILKALVIARKKGFRLPLVYNTGGYDSVKTLKLLDGIVDIYMPDIKYSDNKMGEKYSLVPDYWDMVQKAVKEMFRQVGNLAVSDQGLASRGLLVRHLVLPDGIAGTEKVMKFVTSLSKDTYVNIMGQYYPANKASQYYELNRCVTSGEFQEAIQTAQRVGLHRFD